MRQYQLSATVLENRKIGPASFLLTFRSRQIARSARPGQFVQVRVEDGFSPLLRRPFGVHCTKKDRVEILFEVVGRATEILSGKRPGDRIGVIGPLGRGFDARPVRGQQPVIVAGGIGIAPLFLLAKNLCAGNAPAPLVLLGAKKATGLLREKELRKLGCAVKAATDDGSKGFRGFVTQLLEQVLSGGRSGFGPVYGCGPTAMLRELCRIAAQRRLACQVSLHEHLACGFGACQGCAVNTRSGYRRVCREGPVFDAQEIVWEQKDET